MKQLNVAILGQGRSGHIHGDYLITVLSTSHHVVSHPTPYIAKNMFGCAVADYTDCLQRTTLMVNATPSHCVPITTDLIRPVFMC